MEEEWALPAPIRLMIAQMAHLTWTKTLHEHPSVRKALSKQAATCSAFLSFMEHCSEDTRERIRIRQDEWDGYLWGLAKKETDEKLQMNPQ